MKTELAKRRIQSRILTTDGQKPGGQEAVTLLAAVAASKNPSFLCGWHFVDHFDWPPLLRVDV